MDIDQPKPAPSSSADAISPASGDAALQATGLTVTFTTEPPVKHIRRTGKERRQSGRMKCECVKCNFGEVLDASRTGMRVRGKKWHIPEAGQILTIIIKVDGHPAQIQAKVAHLTRIGRFGYEMGLQFMTMSDASRQMLAQFVAMGQAHVETFITHAPGMVVVDTDPDERE